jgi:hypothetical protein
MNCGRIVAAQLAKDDAHQRSAEQTGNHPDGDADRLLQADAGEPALEENGQKRERRPERRGRPERLSWRAKVDGCKTKNQNKDDAYEYKIEHGVGPHVNAINNYI